MTSANREMFWRFWCAYFKPLRIDPYLEEVYFQTKTRVETGFSGHMKKGRRGRGKHIKVGTVREAIEGVNTKIDLNTGRQPLHQPGSIDK